MFQKKRKYHITKMLDVHHEICRLSVAGKSQVEIAEELNVSRPVVNYTLNSPLGQQKLELLRLQRDLDATSMTSRIRSGAERGMQFLEEIINNQEGGASIPLKTRVALELLDRAGFGKIQRTVNMNLEGKLTEKEIEELTNRAIAVKGTVVDDVSEVAQPFAATGFAVNKDLNSVGQGPHAGMSNDIDGNSNSAAQEDGAKALAAQMIAEIDAARKSSGPQTPYQGYQLKVVGA